MKKDDLIDYFADVPDLFGTASFDIIEGRFFTNNVKKFKVKNDIQEFQDFLIVIKTQNLSDTDRTKMVNKIKGCINVLLIDFPDFKIIQNGPFFQNCYKIGIKKINEIL